MSTSLEAMVERCHAALGEIVRGDAEHWSELFSHEADVSLGNPFGPFVVGVDSVMAAARTASDRYRDGELLGVDRIATYEDARMLDVAQLTTHRQRHVDVR